MPNQTKRLLWLLCIWFIPVLGAVFVYRSLDLSWFRSKKKSSNLQTQAVGGAFLTLDAVFNSGQKYVQEAKQNEITELSEDGDVHDPKKPELAQFKIKE